MKGKTMIGRMIRGVVFPVAVLAITASCEKDSKKPAAPPLTAGQSEGSVVASLRSVALGTLLSVTIDSQAPTGRVADPGKEDLSLDECLTDGAARYSADLRITEYSGCTRRIGDGSQKIVRNGKIQYTPSTDGVGYTLDVMDFQLVKTGPSADDSNVDVTLEQCSMNYRMQLQNTSESARQGCGSFQVPTTKATFQVNGSASSNPGVFSRKLDRDADGVFEVDEEIQATTFLRDLTVNGLDSRCTPRAFNARLSGKTVFTDRLDATRSVTVDIDEEDPVLIVAEGNGRYYLRGGYRITDSCAAGWISVETIQQIEIPDGATCPTAGRVQVTGDLTATIIFGAGGSVQIDLGSDGSIDQEYESCGDVPGCSR